MLFERQIIAVILDEVQKKHGISSNGPYRVPTGSPGLEFIVEFHKDDLKLTIPISFEDGVLSLCSALTLLNVELAHPKAVEAAVFVLANLFALLAD